MDVDATASVNVSADPEAITLGELVEMVGLADLDDVLIVVRRPDEYGHDEATESLVPNAFVTTYRNGNIVVTLDVS